MGPKGPDGFARSGSAQRGDGTWPRCHPEDDNVTVGRLIAVALFIALFVPGVLLVRGWSLGSGRRAVASAAMDFAEPTPTGQATLQRQALHARRVRRLGLLAGIAGIAGSVVSFGAASVFLWPPALAIGLLLGVLLAEATRPRPRWAIARPIRRPRRGEQIAPWLLWSTRAVTAAELVLAVTLARAGQIPPGVAAVTLAAPLVAQLLAEVALLRILVRPLPADGADVPVDEALRTWTAHLVAAAASVLALVPFGALLLVAGIERGDRVTRGFDLLPVALVGGGLSALGAGLGVTVFLLAWLRPVRYSARALAG